MYNGIMYTTQNDLMGDTAFGYDPTWSMAPNKSTSINALLSYYWQNTDYMLLGTDSRSLSVTTPTSLNSTYVHRLQSSLYGSLTTEPGILIQPSNSICYTNGIPTLCKYSNVNILLRRYVN